MNRIALVGTALAAMLLSVLLGLSITRVRALMDRELDVAGERTTLAVGIEPTLVEADLLAGDYVTFELCASDAMEPARWSGAASLVVEAGTTAPREPVLSESVDDAMLAGARRGATGACLDFARAGPLQVGGHYVVLARSVGAGLAGANVRARVLAERPLGPADRNFVLAILVGAMALVLALALRRPTAAATGGEAWSSHAVLVACAGIGLASLAVIALHPGLALAVKATLATVVVLACAGTALALRRGAAGGSAVLAVLAVIDLSTLLSWVTPPGPAFGLGAGLLLAFSEVVVALAFIRALGARRGGETLGALALQRPTRAWVTALGFASAPIVGVLLRIAATRVLALVPSTGEAPIEAYVSWPSGLLSFAALSAIAPVGEEIFFRGLVYGALRGKGGAANETLAFFGAWLLFVVAHLPQTWGSWGGLAAVAVAGLGFTTLRALTGSVLVAALAHLVYNGLLAVAALAAG